MNAPDDTPLDIPDPVRLLAEQRQLGLPLDVRREKTTAAQVGTGVAVAVAGMIVSSLLAAYNSAQTAAAYSGDGGTVSHFFVPSGAMILIGLAMAIRGLAVGTRAHYLYSGGLISKRRSGLRSVTWTEANSLRTVYGRDRGQVTGYRLTGPRRLSLTIPLKTDGTGRDAFIDRLVEFMRLHEQPIQ